MNASSSERVLFVCDDAVEPPWLANQRNFDRRAIRSRGDDADLNLRVAALPIVLKDVATTRSTDLFRIAAYAHRADTALSRGGPRDVHGDHWKRDITLCIPVAEPVVWEDPMRKTRLRRALEFATGDSWDLAFCSGDPVLYPVQRSFHDRLRQQTPTVVTLFSGGVDSFCALLESALHGERPLAVGHWSATPHMARQRDLCAAAAAKQVGGWDFPLVGITINRVGTERAESSQRSRAFLFACLGAVVAAETGIGRVYLADNGPISINLPFNDQLAGAMASRSTHPKFLHLFNLVLEGLFPHPIEISNPLADRTRAEVMAVLPRAGCEHLLARTLSCSAWSRLPASTPQCGVCPQCIDRRIAGIAAGLEEFDPASGYRTDALTEDLSQWKAQTAAESYVRFSKQVRGLDNDALYRAFPQVRDVVVAGDPDPRGSVEAATDLTKRHATMVRDGLKQALKDRLDLYLDGKLAPTCMLIIAGRELGADVDMPVPFVPSPHVGVVAPAGSANAVVWMGGSWQVFYGGVPVTVDALKGMPIIALLLAHPGKPYTAAEIEAELGVIDPDLVAHEPIDAAEGFAGQHYASGGEKLDPPSVTEYRKRIADYDEEIAEAQKNRDPERVSALKLSREFFLKQLREGMKPGGTLEVFANDLSKQHDRVAVNLRRTIKSIQKKNHGLGTHLWDAIKRRSDFVYDPEPSIPWEVFPPAA